MKADSMCVFVHLPITRHSSAKGMLDSPGYSDPVLGAR